MPASAIAALAPIPDLMLRENEPMSQHTSFGVGGPADVLAVPQSVPALRHVLRQCNEQDIPYLVIGNGTNIIFRDGGFRGVVIKMGQPLNAVRHTQRWLMAEAGAGLDRVCVYACEQGLAGLTWAAGIPGTVGGAVWMNAGANGGEMGQYVQRVHALTPEGEDTELTQEALQFSYRFSALQNMPLVVAAVEFALARGTPADLRREMYETIERRLARQPLKERSAGCIFKRPPGDFAGRLIENSGCKGLRVGGAQISPKHAGFIVNLGNATAKDVLQLIDIVRQRVFDAQGVWLEPEVRIVGED